MSEKLKRQKNNAEGKFAERGARWYRNFNLAVGGAALVGAAIAPPVVAAGLGIYAGYNFLQAGGGEWLRRSAKKRKLKKAAPKNKK
jgi:hypothetical protein